MASSVTLGLKMCIQPARRDEEVCTSSHEGHSLKVTHFLYLNPCCLEQVMWSHLDKREAGKCRVSFEEPCAPLKIRDALTEEKEQMLGQAVFVTVPRARQHLRHL